MEHKIKKITEEIDVLELTEEEFQITNDMYKVALIIDGFPVSYVKDLKLRKVILTDGLHRKEFFIQINKDALKGREATNKARRQYLEALENKSDEEQKYLLKELMKMDIY